MTRWIKVTNGERSGRSKVVYLHAPTGSRKYPRLRLPVRYEGYTWKTWFPRDQFELRELKGLWTRTVFKFAGQNGRPDGTGATAVRVAQVHNPFVGPPKHPYFRWTLRRSSARGKLNDKIWRTCLLAASCHDVPLSSVRRLVCLNILHQSQSSSVCESRPLWS